MRRDPDRLNRAVLILLALAAIAVGVWGVGRAAGWFDDRQPDQPLLIPSVADYVARNAHWFWPVAAAAAAVICLLALGWLRAQLRLPRPASTDLVIPATDGQIRVQGDALADALRDDVTTQHRSRPGSLGPSHRRQQGTRRRPPRRSGRGRRPQPHPRPHRIRGAATILTLPPA